MYLKLQKKIAVGTDDEEEEVGHHKRKESVARHRKDEKLKKPRVLVEVIFQIVIYYPSLIQ